MGIQFRFKFPTLHLNLLVSLKFIAFENDNRQRWNPDCGYFKSKYYRSSIVFNVEMTYSQSNISCPSEITRAFFFSCQCLID